MITAREASELSRRWSSPRNLFDRYCQRIRENATRGNDNFQIGTNISEMKQKFSDAGFKTEVKDNLLHISWDISELSYLEKDSANLADVIHSFHSVSTASLTIDTSVFLP